MTQPTSAPRVRAAIGVGSTGSETPPPHDPPASGDVRAALEVTLAALHAGGRIEPIDAARVQVARSLADRLDGKSGANSQMWREFREVLEALTADVDDSSELGELIQLLRPEVRDPA